MAFALPLKAQPAPERHSEVLLLIPANGDLQARLAAHGVGIDHMRREETERGAAVRVVLSEHEVAAAREAGIEVEVLVDDLTAHYLATRSGACEDGASVASRITANLCGSMGGYPTFADVAAHLDTLHARYPEIVSAKTSIGQSWEGRDLWMVEISDHPGQGEGEAEALYTGVHHAREPGSMMAVLYFMYYLGEQYAANPDIAALVDTRRLFFVPILNPDGYVYNETTNPDGGGFWRKNLRDDGDGAFGVDLNRNYGYEWGHDDIGSSPAPFSNTYRGPAPFSEPEVAALRDFVEGRHISAALNYHTYSELLLYPWGYTRDIGTPDAAAFAALGDRLTRDNSYFAGQISQVLYLANGNSDDWMYGGQTTKPKILVFTPEVGYAFWPDPIDVYQLADENLEANLILARSASLTPPVESEPEATSSELSLEVVGANPARSITDLVFTLAVPSLARLTVYDMLGREVAVLADGVQTAGHHSRRFEVSGMAAGIYLLRLTANGEVATRRLTVIR